jgi:hypothetical protein
MTFAITSWEELALLISIVAAIAGVGGGMIKSGIDRKTAEASASDRIIRLIEQESEKRVEVVRTEFKLKIAEMQLEHRSELETVKADFEREIRELRNRGSECSAANCPNRNTGPIRIRATRSKGSSATA